MGHFVEIGDRVLNLDKISGFRLHEKDGETILFIAIPLMNLEIRGEGAKQLHAAIHAELSPKKLDLPPGVVLRGPKTD